MTSEKIAFAKKADKFIVHSDDGIKTFSNYPDAAMYYNNHINDNYVELCAVCGAVGVTLAYHKR